MATRAEWISGTRPRTLPASVAPVLAGTGAAAQAGDASALRAVLAMVVALALQVGVNFANDYSDGIRGTDDDRVGPFRLTGSGAARAQDVRNAAFGAFAVAAVAGFVLVALSGRWWLLLVGAACVAAAWYYTGGKRPYGYAGLGEVFVFVFFGLVAVLGTAYTQAGRITWPAVAAAVGVGALACALLVANNLRDLPGDTAVGKRTLAVRLGDPRTRQFYLALVAIAGLAVLVAAATGGGRNTLIGLIALPLAGPPVQAVRGGASGRELLPVLRDTGRLELAYGIALGAGLALSGWAN